jgi:hypothetical protein
VIQVTTADRVDREIYRAWNRRLTPVRLRAQPHAGARTATYIGKHRRPTSRLFSLRALFYFARHRR